MVIYSLYQSLRSCGVDKMLISTSYFYRIRQFLPNMIPVSTCMWDPAWFHSNGHNGIIFKDKRGIVNGIRFEYMIVQGDVLHRCPCEEEDYTTCGFLKDYRAELEKLDFDFIMRQLQWLGEQRKKIDKFEGEPHIVLIVYEAPYNHCSERTVLQKYFQDHGISCQELKYPIRESDYYGIYGQ